MEHWENTVNDVVSVCKDPKRWSWALHLLKRLSKLDEENFNSNASDVCFAACRNGSFFLVKHLIEAYKFNPEVKDIRDQTLLYAAALGGHLDMVKYLVEECKCNPEVKDRHGQTPLIGASEYGNLDTVKYLIEECRATITEKSIEDADTREIKNYLLEQQKEQKSNQNQ